MLNFWILWINARNLHYIGKHNPVKSVRLADNKITTKLFLTERWIPLPETYAVIQNRSELAHFDFFSLPHTDFIIKPARWSRGRGIFRVKKLKDYVVDHSLFTTSLTPTNWLSSLFWTKKVAHEVKEQHRFEVQGQVISESLLKTYCLDILDGKESLQGKPDHILIEEMLIPWDGFEAFCEQGLADIRVIVYNFVPVAAMLRVPTEASAGKANLDRGWVWLGVEVGSGKIQSMFLNGNVYKEIFPEPYTQFLWKKLSYREDILQRSTQIQYYVNLWYLALDRVITETWPKLLEINARAGLKIQLALDLPLRHRLEKIGDLKIDSPEKGVEICQTLFSQHKTGLIAPNRILPQHAYATIRNSLWVQHEVTVNIDLSKSGVRMDEWLAAEFKQMPSCTITYPYDAAKVVFDTWEVDSKLWAHQIVLWGDIVKNYFVKPVVAGIMKKEFFRPEMIFSHEQDLLHLLDSKLARLWSKLIFSRYLRPQNFLEQFDKFLSLQGKYNPTFTYQRPSEKKLMQIKSELSYIRDEFRQKSVIESPLLQLFGDKLDELFIKQQLLVAYKKQDFELLAYLQPQYRWLYNESLAVESRNRLQVIHNDRKDLWPVLWRKSIKREVFQYLHARWWDAVEVKFTPDTFARMSVKKYGSRLVLQISSGSTFRKLDLYAALAHELVHIERYSNATESSWQILSRGTAGYFIDEEWLAIWAAEQELPDAYEKTAMWEKYLYIKDAFSHNYVQMADIIRTDSDKSLNIIFKDVYRLKRGVEDTIIIHPWTSSLKDGIYVQWYTRVSDWIASWSNISELMVGKIKIEDRPYFFSI